MATAEGSSIILRLDDEMQGERIGSDDYCFVETGEPVPISSGDDSEFDLQSPPSKPLSVSERFGIIFVSHSTGFCVARTKDVIKSSKEIAEKQNGLSIKELSVVDVLIGQVYILALSADSSTLAACIDGNIHFFSISSLLNKEQSPSFSCLLDESSCVKDMQWTKKLANYYLVLSNHGKLFYGAGQVPLKNVMDNVDAFDWSVKGNLVAVARKNTLSIMSSKLKEKVSMSLSFESWISDINYHIKVDSIRWVRPDSIILGCFQLTSDGQEENYLVQVITSKDGKFTDTSSKPILLSFSDMFEALIDDIVPFGSGPYMSVSYLNKCELAITANRKSTDQHIVLFGWSADDKKEAAVIDILRDTMCPKIALQGDGGDNIVLGLCLDSVSQNEKVEVQLGAEYKELSPFCILLCLSLDGKLFMYQVASVTGTSVASDVSVPSDEEHDTPTLVSSEDAKPGTSVLLEKSVQGGLAFQSQEVNKKELPIKEGSRIPATNVPTRPVNSETLETLGQRKLLVTMMNQDTDGQQSQFSALHDPYFGHSSPKTSDSVGPGLVVRDFNKEETKKLSKSGVDSVSFPEKFSSHVSSQAISTTLPRAVDLCKELPEKLESSSLKSALSNPTPNAERISRLTSDGGFSLRHPGSSQSNQSDNSVTSKNNAHFPGIRVGNFSSANQAAGPSTAFSSSGKTANSGVQCTSTSVGIAQPLSGIRNSVFSSQQNFTLGNSKAKFQPNKEKYRGTSPTRLLISEPHLSKQFGNVEEMIKELETLMECITGSGGFRDSCTVLHENSVLELEEGIESLFNRCRLWKSIMDERLGETRLVLDDTVQVLARKIYMEGIVKQATDGQYLDLWNHQKLSSELELKQQHISKLNQELTNQLVELERHLNTLELNKFGKSNDIQMSQRTFPGRYRSSRSVPSLRSLRSTMSSQLETAEQLSECLAKQMAVLSIEPPSARTQNVRRELFEEIGIPYNSTIFSSPDGKLAVDTNSNKEFSTSSCSDAVKDQSSVMRGCESESVRRRRDSLDRSWASFEPPKTTVKRMLLHENQAKASEDRSALVDKKHLKFRLPQGSEVALAERYNTTPTLFYPSQEKGTRDRSTKQASTFSSHFASISSTANLSNTGVTTLEKHESISVNDFESIHKSQIEQHQISSNSKRVHGKIFSLPKKPGETSNSNSKETYIVMSTIGDGKHQPSITKSSFVEYGKGLESPFYHSSIVDPSPNSNAQVFQSDIAAIKSQSGRVASSPTFMFSTSSSSSSSLPNPAEQTSSLSISIGRFSTSFEPSTHGSQTTLLSQSSGSSSSILSAVSSSEVSEKAVHLDTPIPCTNFETESLGKEQQPPIPKLSATTDKTSMNQDLSPKNEPSFTLKLESSLPFRPGGEPSANFQSGSKLSFGGMETPTTNESLNSKPRVSFATDVMSAGTGCNRKIESPQDAVTQEEDGMEEEVPETSKTVELALGSLGSFGIASSPHPTPASQNPFGRTFASVVPTPATSPFSMTVPTGELFRPASFSFQSPQPFQPSPATNFGPFSGGLSSGTTLHNSAAGSGFGQPAQLGSGQQALGSVLGAFGQSRQLGGVVSGTIASFSSGGLISSPSTGGFASSNSVGFAGAASAVGGFAGAASASGGFGGFAGAGSVVGFPSSGGGFGSFNSHQGSGGFSSFGGAGGAGMPTSTLFTQMRK